MSGFLTKIAHNNRVSLGPKDIRPLAELISTEKRLVDATTKLSTERTKSSAALREWGASEGADLSDVLGKMAHLFDELAKAELVFAEHDANHRLQFKSIRSREELLAQLKRNQASLASKIDSQDRKVSKMKEENKDLPAAVQKLRDMRSEMVGLENSVLHEETELGDFKRATTRQALSLKIGALLELAEKTVVIGEIGKLLMDEIPTERTEPGYPRALYTGYDKTEAHMLEATRCLSEVVFNPAPLSATAAGGQVHSSDEARWVTPSSSQPPELGSYDSESPYQTGRYGAEYSDPAYGTYAAQSEYASHQQEPPSPYQSQPAYPSNIPSISGPPLSPVTEFVHLAPSSPAPDVNRSSLAYMTQEEEEEQEQRRLEEEWALESAAAHPKAEELPDLPVPPPPPFAGPEATASPLSSAPTPEAVPEEEKEVEATTPAPAAPPPPPSFPVRPPSTTVSQAAARPAMIRGESALGSKHGDVFVPGSNGATSLSGSVPANGERSAGAFLPLNGGGGSGYNPSSGGGGGAKVINAGAFRRPVPPPQSQYSMPPMSDSRYPTTAVHDPRYPVASEANAIRDQYYANSQSQQPNGGDTGDSLQGSRSVGESAPRFDVTPLQVAPKKPSTRSSTMPSYSGSSGQPDHSPAPQEPWRDQEGHPPPPSYGHGSTVPASPSSNVGFNASQFVTKLD